MNYYQFREECGGCDLMATDQPKIALESWVNEGDYGQRTKTQWIDASYREVSEAAYAAAKGHGAEQIDESDYIGEAVSVSVTLVPEEPMCQYELDGDTATEDEHDYKQIGGARGNGGGVIVTEVCTRCGLKQITDTWATGPGCSQGYTSVEYCREVKDVA